MSKFPLVIANPPKKKSGIVRRTTASAGVAVRRHGPAIMRRAVEVGKEAAGNTVGFIAAKKLSEKICAKLGEGKAADNLFNTNKGRALVGFGLAVAFDATVGRKIPGGYGKSITSGMATYAGIEAARSIPQAGLSGYMSDGPQDNSYMF